MEAIFARTLATFIVFETIGVMFWLAFAMNMLPAFLGLWYLTRFSPRRQFLAITKICFIAAIIKGVFFP
jgi:hypothetical protein